MPGKETHAVPADDPGNGALSQLAPKITDRIQEVLDSAERLALEIQSEAEETSARYLEERRREVDRVVDERIRDLAAFTESLAVRAKAVERETTALVSELEDAMRRMSWLASESGGEPPAEPASEPVAYAFPGTRASQKVSDQARLRATQMAVAGTDRAEIERMLRSEFGVEDPAAVVDSMLRSESA